MLSHTALTIFDVLCTTPTATPETLAEETTHDIPEIERTINTLLETDLLKQTPTTAVQLAVHPVTEAYRTLNATAGHIDWPELLTPAAITLCWYLNTPTPLTPIANRLNTPEKTLRNTLEPLQHQAIITTPQSHTTEQLYTLANNLNTALHAFLTELIRDTHRRRVRSYAPTATIPWCDPQRALVHPHTRTDTQTLTEHPEWNLTGLAKFTDYNLQFFLATEPCFWYAPTEPTIADIACHTLLLEADSRRTKYTLLLLDSQHISENTAVETATWYDLNTEITALYDFLHNRPITTDPQTISLPTKHAYTELKTQYNIT